MDGWIYGWMTKQPDYYNTSIFQVVDDDHCVDLVLQ